MSEELLLKDWNKFVSLLPEERIIYIVKNVDVWSKTEEITRKKEEKELGDMEVKNDPMRDSGDLILTNKRLIHLKYMYKIEREPSVLGFIEIGTKKKKELPTPTGYEYVKFDIPLDKIVSVESTSPIILQVKLAYNAEIIKLNFLNIVNFLGSNRYDFNSIIRSMNFDLYAEQRKQETNEFRKNLSSLVYEIQHRPKEVVSYNIVTEFNLNKDGTISVKCPYCGAPTPLHSKESEVVCKYCGKTYIVPKKILDLIS